MLGSKVQGFALADDVPALTPLHGSTAPFASIPCRVWREGRLRHFDGIPQKVHNLFMFRLYLSTSETTVYSAPAMILCRENADFLSRFRVTTSPPRSSLPPLPRGEGGEKTGGHPRSPRPGGFPAPSFTRKPTVGRSLAPAGHRGPTKEGFRRPPPSASPRKAGDLTPSISISRGRGG